MNTAPEPNDQDLVREALAQPDAFALIVRRYEARLKRYLARYLHGRLGEADDLLQEVFLKAYVNLNDYDSDRPLSPWLYRIAHNEAVSYLRRHRATPPMISGEDGRKLIEAVADRADALLLLERAEVLKLLERALGGLDPRYRDAMVLRYLEEHSYEEIADILKLPMGSVATLIRRGGDKLRQTLNGMLGTSER